VNANSTEFIFLIKKQGIMNKKISFILSLIFLALLTICNSCDFFLDEDEGIIRTMSVRLEPQLKIDSFENCQESYKLRFVTVSIEMRKRIDENNEEAPYYCSGALYVWKNDKKIDSLIYANFEPVGGDYGLRVHDKLINGCLIITKHGDYDGETIFINPEGKIKKCIGGIPHYSKDKNWVISFYESDLGGFSIFDLGSFEEIFSKSDIEHHGITLAENANLLFLHMENSDDLASKYFVFDALTKELSEANYEDFKKARELKSIEDYRDYAVFCTCKAFKY
jgi:hypothetical protein